jgi:carboxypeptidase C (cathepsin A)
MVDGEAAGEYKKTDNLTFLRVFDAGHMVPMDQPKVALEMLREFIHKEI